MARVTRSLLVGLLILLAIAWPDSHAEPPQAVTITDKVVSISDGDMLTVLDAEKVQTGAD